MKLADFGVAAKLSGGAEGDESLRQSVAGTPYWMAPEVIEMTSVTAAADIWSVGCLSIELLTGQPPYFDLQPMSALFRIVQVRHLSSLPGIVPNSYKTSLIPVALPIKDLFMALSEQELCLSMSQDFGLTAMRR